MIQAVLFNRSVLRTPYTVYITVDIQREQSITLQFRIYRLLFNNT